MHMLDGGPVIVLYLVIAAPLLEEALFRGILLRAFLHHYTPATAIMLSALLFGFMHFNVVQTPASIILGCYLGWLFYASRSLWPCILAHAMINGLSYLFYLGDKDQPEASWFDYNHPLVDLLTLSLSLAGIWMAWKILHKPASISSP